MLGGNGAMLLRFSQDGNVAGVKRQIAAGTSVDHADGNGATALMKASSYGKIDVVKCLHRSKANVNKQDNYGGTALMKAAEYGNIEIVQFLVENAKANISLKNDDGDTAMVLAKKAENHTIARYLSCMHDIIMARPMRSHARVASAVPGNARDITWRREENQKRMRAFEEKSKEAEEASKRVNSLECQLRDAREKMFASSVVSEESSRSNGSSSSRLRRHRRGQTVAPGMRSSRSRSSRSPDVPRRRTQSRSPVLPLDEDLGKYSVASYEDYKATQKRIFALENQIREAEETRKRVAALETLLNKSLESARPGPPPLVHVSSRHLRGKTTMNFSGNSRRAQGGFHKELKERAGEYHSHKAQQRYEESKRIRELEERLRATEEKLNAYNRAKHRAEKNVSSLLSVSHWSAFSAEKKLMRIPGMRTLRMDVSRIRLDKRTNLAKPHLIVSVVSSKGVPKGRACEIPLEGSATILMGPQDKGVYVFVELKHLKRKKNFTKASTLGFAFFEAVCRHSRNQSLLKQLS